MQKNNVVESLSENKRILFEKWKRGEINLHENISKRSLNNKVALSFAQQRLWFLEQLIPNTPAYNITYLIKINGNFNVIALKNALTLIIQRQEIFRTKFLVEEGKPYQEISNFDVTNFLQQIDLREVQINERDKVAYSHINKMAKEPFDLTKLPLFRALFIRLDDHEQFFFLCLHHIIADGWSLGILQKELIYFYKNLTLPPLKIQYQDFSEWQKNQFHKDKFQSQISYWKKRLDKLQTKPLLQPDKIRSTFTNYTGDRHLFKLPQNLVTGFKNLAQEKNVTLYIVLITALKILLHRYSHENDIAVGCPIANRNQQQVENLIGFFVNTIVMRNEINGNNNFLDVLDIVKNTALEAYSNQDLPFEFLVESLKPERKSNVSSPFFQVAFVLQNIPSVETELLTDLKITSLSVFNGTSPFDLLLSLTEINGELVGFFEYSTEIFLSETISRFTENFKTLLIDILNRPNIPIAHLNVLSENERQFILNLSSANKNFKINNCIHQRFEEVVKKYPNNIAVTFADEQLNYYELNKLANQLAHELHRKGVVAESRIGIYLNRSINLTIAVLAVLKAGGTYVPIDPTFPNQRIENIVNDADLFMIVTQFELQDKLSPKANIICIDNLFKEPKIEDFENLPVINTPFNVAYIIFTSGSTGKPKGVLVEHRNVLRLFDATDELFTFNQNDVWSLFHSLAFDFSVWELWGALLHGGRLVIIPYDISRSTEEFCQIIDHENVTVLNQTPSAFKLLQQFSISLDKLRYVIFGGEALELSTLNPWFEKNEETNTKLINMYGITETTVHVTYKHIVKKNTDSINSNIGRPLPDLACYLLDSNRQLVPIGVAGEMYIGGAGVSRGYFKRPDLTVERFIKDTFSSEEEMRLYKSGDFARLSSNGEIEFLGRMDEQVKIRGFRIELGEIQATLKQHPKVLDAIVCLKEDVSNHKSENKILIAYFIENQVDKISFNLDQKINNQWKEVFNQTYENHSLYPVDFNISGWNSAYDGKPIPAEQMQEWVNLTVEQILVEKPLNILELGCGTGLLLFRLAPFCVSYLGTDISTEAIHYLSKNTKNLSNVTLNLQKANELDSVSNDFYDMVVLNSVVQYFPRIEYLIEVLEKILQKIQNGGKIFIGDIRDLSRLESFYKSIEIYKEPDNLSEESLKNRIELRAQNEHELIIDPEFFYVIKKVFPAISEVKINFKKGRSQNELTEFRYDVLLHIDFKDYSQNIYIAEKKKIDWKIYANRPRYSTKLNSDIEIRNFLKEKLPDYMVPTFCFAIDEIPLTINGKIDHKALPLPSYTRPNLKNEFLAPRTLLEKKISEVWILLLGITEIGVHDSFFELGGHSLLAAELIFKLRDTLGSSLPLRVLFETPTIAWMAETIQAQQQNDNYKAVSTLSLYDEVDKHALKINPVTVEQAQKISCNHILLTGATGFFGAFILNQLLDHTQAIIFCLVRAANHKEGFDRLNNNMAKYGFSLDDKETRIQIVVGDLSQHLFGLNKLSYDYLDDHIDCIYHNGSKVNFISPYKEHKAANVLGTQEIIRLANKNVKKPKLVHYISTTHVFSDLDAQQGILYENTTPSHPESLLLGYTQSKWVAEQMIAKAAAKGLPAYIYRPGRIWGDSLLGHCQSDDFLWLIIKAAIHIKAAPDLDLEINVTPVNFASAALVELSKLKNPFGTAYNIVNPHYTSWREVVTLLKDFGYDLTFISMNAWCQKITELSNISKNMEFKSLIPLLEETLDRSFTEELKINNCNTQAGLVKSGIICPKLDVKLLKTYVNYFVNTGFFEGPKNL